MYAVDDNEDDYYTAEYKNIPGLLMKVWGKLSEDKYQLMKNNSSWLDMTTRVCDDCYLKFTTAVTESIEERKAKEKQKHMRNSTKTSDDNYFSFKSGRNIKI